MKRNFNKQPHAMRLITHLPSLLTMLIVLFSTNASAQVKTPDAAQAMSELRAAHDGWNAAVESGDFKRVRSFFVNNFIMRAGNKILTLIEIEQILQLSTSPEVIERKHSSVIKKLKFDGPDAILTTQHAHIERHKLIDGSIRVEAREKQQQERWVKEGNEWKLAVIENIKAKESEVWVDGRKVSSNYIAEVAAPVAPNAEDKPILNSGMGLVFIYRLNDFAIIKPPIYVNDAKVAQMTGGSFLKIKLQPGKYSLKSDKGDPIDVAVQAGKIVFLSLKLDAGFPKGRGVLRMEKSILGPQAYKFPRLLDLTPLGADNIDDPTKAIIAQ